ncbi:MAG: hypothetical protein HRU24_09235 [Gammaproteobacteria bacterium]|nr:hypothetical protein [Gammaproteobacteria bacterium]
MNHYIVTLGLMMGLGLVSPSYAITPEEVAVPRLLVLSEISRQASIDEVLALANEGSVNEMRQQFVFTALIRIGASHSGDAYAKTVLDAGTASVTTLRGALGYLASHPASWMNHYAQTYISPDKPGAVRSMAANLAGRLGLTNQKSTIITILNNNSYGNWRIHAALGLAHLVGRDEFKTLLAASSLGAWDKKLVTQYNDFLASPEQEKDVLAKKLMRRSEQFLALAALEYLLSHNKTALLKQYHIIKNVEKDGSTSIAVSSDYYRSLFRILGYQVTGDIDAFEIEKLPLI